MRYVGGVRRSSIALVLASGALVGFAACGGGDDAPDVPAPPPEPVVEAPPPEPEGPPPGFDHALAEGETLWNVARLYGVSVDAIMEANDLDDRDVRRMRRGAVLRIPGVTGPVAATPETPEVLPPLENGAYHRLGEGETLWDVARLYDVSVDDIVTANALDDEAVRLLRPGRSIAVPGITDEAVARATEGREAAGSERRGFRHTVAHGETIWDLSRSFGVSVSEIMAANRLDAGEAGALREGDDIFIPGVSGDDGGSRGEGEGTPRRRALSPRQTEALARARTLGLGTHDAASDILHGRLRPEWTRAASRTFERGRTPGTLRWPVANGWFVRGFGSGEGGYHQAFDIMGEIGWNVRSSAPGIVGYSGDEIPGYGNVVFVIHPGGWVTMYAHNSVNFVVAGERVPAGGILAELGSTGISRGPHVHYELIFDGQNCDPGPLFRPGIRHHDGHLTPMRYLSWERAGDRPESIRCERRRHHPHSRWVSAETGEEESGGSGGE